jgi:hypothetical protein
MQEVNLLDIFAENDTKPKQFVFVLMAFDKKFEDIYKLGIKPACQEAGAYCERVDEQIFQESILQRIYNQIAKADIIVSDMTGRNPNVFYETGYAHALGKRVILLTQDAEDIPFDLKHYPHIVYKGSITTLKDELKRRVRWFIENPEKSLKSMPDNLEFFLRGLKLYDGVDIVYFFEESDEAEGQRYISLIRGRHIYRTIRFNLDLHNPSNRVYDASSIQLGLVLPREFEDSLGGTPTAHLSNDRCMHIVSDIGKILPGSWKPVIIDINVKGEKVKNKEFDCALRIFSEVGSQDIKFKIHFITEAEAKAQLANLPSPPPPPTESPPST